MRIDKTRINLLITLQCCLLLVAVGQPQQVVVGLPDDVRAAVISMLPEGDIMAEVVLGKMTAVPAPGAALPAAPMVRFSIASDGRFFRFWADGRLPALEAVRIDLTRNKVLARGQQLDYAGAIHTPLDSALKSGWRGHRWAGVTCRDPDNRTDSIAKPGNRYTLILGQLDHTGQTFLRLREEEAGSGTAGKMLFDLSLLF